MVAVDEVTCLSLPRSTFIGLRGPMREVLELNMHMMTLRAMTAWHQLREGEGEGEQQRGGSAAAGGVDAALGGALFGVDAAFQ